MALLEHFLMNKSLEMCSLVFHFSKNKGWKKSSVALWILQSHIKKPIFIFLGTMEQKYLQYFQLY